MARKGYYAEWIAKHSLMQKYPKEDGYSIWKIAISSEGPDFVVIKEGRIIKVIEIKSTRNMGFSLMTIFLHGNNKRQLNRMREFAKANNCEAELWLRRGKKWERASLSREDFYAFKVAMPEKD